MKKSELKEIIMESVVEALTEMHLPKGMRASSIISLDNFVKGMNEADMLGAKTAVMSPDDMNDYLGRIDKQDKNPKDKYKLPYIHRGNIPIKDEANRTFDLDKLRAAIETRPLKVLKQNEKITHSGGDSTIYFNIGLPALKGLAVNEKTGDFIVVDTCPGAGACVVYCYAKKGGYVQWKASSMSQTKMLNFLVNDPEGFKNKLSSELQVEVSKYDKKNTKVVVRWHDAGDFFSQDYLALAYEVAKKFPMVDFYAYTKIAGVAMGKKPENFKINFSMGAAPGEEKQIDFKTTKHSTVVPKPMFDQYIMKDNKGNLKKDNKGRIQFLSSSAEKEFKLKLSQKYKLDLSSVITYDELMKIPAGKDKKYNVIVKPGDGDDSANRADVLGTYLLIH